MNEILRELRHAWSEARAGRGAFRSLVAPIGAGKSTLAAQLVKVVRGSVGPGSVGISAVHVRLSEARPLQPQTQLELTIERVAEGVRVVGAEPEAARDSEPVPWLLPSVDFLGTASQVAALPGAETDTARIYAELLLDVARVHPVLLVIDDVQRADARTQALVEALVAGIAAYPDRRLLLVSLGALPLSDAEGVAQSRPWRPGGIEPQRLSGVSAEVLTEIVEARCRRYGPPRAGFVEAIVKAAHGKPSVAEAMVDVCGRRGGLLGDLTGRSDLAGLRAVARDRMPAIEPAVRADLQVAATVGTRFSAETLAAVWGVDRARAALRVQVMRGTGLVMPSDWGDRFLSHELAAVLAEEVPEAQRGQIHGVAGVHLRGAGIEFATASYRPRLDVTETWSENRRREQGIKRGLMQIWLAVDQFARAERWLDAAEACVALVERVAQADGIPSVVAARYDRRVQRERRHRVRTALDTGARLLERLEGGGEAALAVHVRHLAARARFAIGVGLFSDARASARAAVEMAGHLDGDARLVAARVWVEVSYAAGDSAEARRGLSRLLALAEAAPKAGAAEIYGWLIEITARWEWVGLHGRLFKHLVDRLEGVGAHRTAIRARVERLVAALEADDVPTAEAALVAVTQQALEHGELPHLAERLALQTADLIQMRVDGHFDSLSGEFFPADLEGESQIPGHALPERLARPVDLLMRAEVLSEEVGDELAQLRVLTTILGCIFEVRERLGELLERWLPSFSDDQEMQKAPVRLVELSETLERGFFDTDHVASLTGRCVALAKARGLDQVLADTLYESLEREMPGAMDQFEVFFTQASEAYVRVGDAYGLVTLSLVKLRYELKAGRDGAETLAAARVLMEARGKELSAEQLAFVRFRFGEHLREDPNMVSAAMIELEAAIQLYDQVGDMERVQLVGDLLQEMYRDRGDLAGYRSLRQRFQGLEAATPGMDAMGLELRVEHLFNLARQTPDDLRAIEMVERCVRLFGRLPHGAPRVDECFVEISKICRRRADESQSEAGFHEWLRRSLEAVRTAAAINRGLGNYHRVFEESRELFDDLIGIGAFDEYRAVRAETRELAFTLGKVSELLYLFQEQLSADEAQAAGLTETRAFFEALLRYLLGLGAWDEARRTQAQFVEFLSERGESALAARYKAWQLDGERGPSMG